MSTLVSGLNNSVNLRIILLVSNADYGGRIGRQRRLRRYTNTLYSVLVCVSHFVLYIFRLLCLLLRLGNFLYFFMIYIPDLMTAFVFVIFQIPAL